MRTAPLLILLRVTLCGTPVVVARVEVYGYRVVKIREHQRSTRELVSGVIVYKGYNGVRFEIK